MIFAQLAQVDISTVFNDIYVRFGAVALILVLGTWMLFRLFVKWLEKYLENKNANTTQDIERIKEDIRRDTLISDLAEKSSKYADRLTIVEAQLASANGKVDLLTTQLETEREKRQNEKLEFKGDIRGLSESVDGQKKRIDELQLIIEEKNTEIAKLIEERDSLIFKLADSLSARETIDKTLREKLVEIDDLRAKVSKLATDLKVAKPDEIVDLDATIPVSPELAMKAIEDRIEENLKKETQELTVIKLKSEKSKEE